jgi:DNA-binding SARP family transcriptional activator/tetratricopeptide (TPR) repeat protein
MEPLEVRLLGGFSLARGGRPLEQLPLRAARSLFAFLVLNRDRAHTRDLLAGTFWPDFDEPRARRRLSQALWQVQTLLGDDDGAQYLIGTANAIRFNAAADFWLDVDEFEAALAAVVDTDPQHRDLAAVQHVITLYSGDLLAGFYDDWLYPHQDRLRNGFLGALRLAVDLAMAKGDHEVALAHARRLTQEDEFDEEAHRQVMRTAVLLGRHHEAIRQFEECQRVFEEELGTSPSPETIALYEATLADREAGPRARPGPNESPLFGDGGAAPFVGREGERSRLAYLLDSALDGHGTIVLIEGESGVGKTRLLAEVADDARWRGMDVLWGRSTPSGGRPFAPLSEALGAITGLRARQLATKVGLPWREVLERLAPAIGEGGGDHTAIEQPRRADDRHRMREAITAAFQGVAALAPTLIVLEDVHWADDDTVQALTHLAENVSNHRLLVAVSYRHGEARDRSDVWQLLRGLDRLENCERVSLTPYSPAQTEELIRKSLDLPEVAGDFSERLHRDTGGIPLFIVETLRALHEKDDLEEAQAPSEEAPPSRDELPVTPTVHALIRHRLDGLDPASRETLELMATHDGDLLLEEVVAASALGEGDSLAAVDDLVRRRLLTGGEGSFQVEHELMRRVVYDDLPLSRRLDLHRRIALAIEERRPEQIEVLAHHFSTARVSDRAADYLERAADHALAVHAYDTAALHLERAAATLAEIGASSERQFAVAALLEEVLDVLGRREDQEHALQRMQRHASTVEQSDVHRRRAWWLAHQDRFAEAEEEAQLALQAARSSDDGGRVVAALTAGGMIACFGGRAAEGVRFLEEAADVHGADRRQEADARNALGQNLIDLQRFGEAESQLLSALALYEDLGDARGQADVLGMLGTLRMERGEPESAEASFQRSIELSRKIGYRHGEAVGQMNLAILRVITNRLGDALESFEAAADTYRLMGNRRGRALVQSNAAWLWHALIGDQQHARSLIDDSMATYEEIGDTRGQAQCLALMGSIVGRDDRPEDAIAYFEKALQLTREASDAWLTAQALREYAYFELEHGDPERGVSHALEAERLCAEFGMNDLVVGIRALLGRLHLRNGEVDRARRVAESAMREIRPGIELAHVVPFALAEVLMQAGERAQAERLITSAYEQLMATLSDLSRELKQSAITNVPHNAAIAEAWRNLRSEVAVFRISSAEAPRGRPLTPDDYVEVEWTLHHPTDRQVKARVERRRKRLLRLIEEAEAQGAAPTVADLARALEASPATVRRDIADLRKDHPNLTTRGSRFGSTK